MHFWIDKRSPFGPCIGPNRSLAGFNHQRRLRSKSMVTPIKSYHHNRQHHQVSEQHQHHNNSAQSSHHPTPMDSSTSSSSSSPIPSSQTAYRMPVIHSVYRHNTMTLADVNVTPAGPHNADNLSIITDDLPRTSEHNQFQPIYLKFGISVALATILLTLKLYFDHQMTSVQFISFAAIAILFLMLTCVVALLRRQKQLPPMNEQAAQQQRNQQQHQQQMPTTFQSPAVPSATNSINYESIIAQRPQQIMMGLGPPPPYHIAILLPDNAKIDASKMHDESPPPTYDKIAII